MIKNMGRPPNSIRELCKQYVFNDRLIERLAKIATGDNNQTKDRIRAIEILLDRSYGKPEQALDITTHESADRPTTEALIQTITALRAELDLAREGAGVAKEA